MPKTAKSVRTGTRVRDLAARPRKATATKGAIALQVPAAPPSRNTQRNWGSGVFGI